ncbi:MAG: ATP-binding protein, partial [Thermoprotei archaeon]
MFVNREEELKLLHEVFSSGKAELVLLYGRRRVGKTRLLLEALKDFENSIYLLADLSESILDIFAKEISRKYGFIRFANWEEFFEFLYSRASREPFIVVIDEFQYLYKVYKPWVTVLQRWWERLKETSIKLVLCGSIISAIYKVGVGYGSALYGRKTYEIEVKPLRFL